MSSTRDESATPETALLKGEVMKVLIMGAGIGTRRKTATAYGHYERAKSRQASWGTRGTWRARVWRWCARCSARSRQREALSELDARLLDDIGVTRQQANVEAAKPFWR
jgi:uncharacterized protein YjiS (DUF1127 family)